MYNSEHKQVPRLCSQETKEWVKITEEENAILLYSLALDKPTFDEPNRGKMKH